VSTQPGTSDRRDPEGASEPSGPAPRVAVIVLNWNGRDDSIACLESLEKLAYPNFEALLVDNGSVDGSVAAIRRRFARLEIIETGRNLGFAEGNNVGIRIALDRGADYVLLLNNDTIVHPALLDELVAAAERCPEGGIFGAKILYHAEPDRIWYGGARWHDELMRFQHCYEDAQIQTDARGVAAVEYACGCALLAKSAVWRAVGLLDPIFFLTYEDTDLCFRARRAGFACYYVPAARLWHKISTSFGGADSPLFVYFMTRNLLLWGERHLGWRQRLRLYRSVLGELKRQLLPRPRSGAIAQGRAMACGIWHYVIRRFGDAPEHVRRLARPS
jgi:GT2 family glycosyltransferase